jgi:hypothetical protein
MHEGVDEIPHNLTTRQQRILVDRVAQGERVRDLAGFLGLEPEVIAAGLVEAVQRDATLRESVRLDSAA